MRQRATIVAFVALILAMVVAPPTHAQHSARPAPEWDISEWINTRGLSLADLRGRVVLVEFFQLWCPGCNKFSIPLMEHWKHNVFSRELAEGRLVFVSIHTVFEGHGFQTPARLRRFVQEKHISHAVGIDRHIAGQHHRHAGKHITSPEKWH